MDFEFRLNTMKKRLLASALLGIMTSVGIWAQAGAHYIIHSSGNVLALGSEDRAQLKKNTDTSVKKLRFAKQSDGSYIIALDRSGQETLYLSLGTANGWSTYFLPDSTLSNAHYKVEAGNGEYIRLKNMKTNAYLGTDSNDAGANAFSDKSGSDMKHQWLLADVPNYKIPTNVVSYPIVLDAPRQTNEGWGVSLCWWAGQVGKWTDKKIDQMVDWMVSPTGLNWNIFRYNIGGGDDPAWSNCTQHHMGGGKGLRAEMEGFQDERGGEYLWNRDAAQRKIMLKIKEKRPDAIFEAFSNSAPWWMTVSGCVAGNAEGGKDNLKKDYYEDFADYLVTVCKHYKDVYGIEFKTLEPFNEAMTGYWHQSGAQEGCHFDVDSEVAFLKVLAPKLKASGLNTVISASDETSVMDGLGSMRKMLSDGIAKEVGQFNTHTYGASNAARSQYGSLARANGKMCWMSETGSGGSGIAGNLTMSQRLFDDVRYICPEAWIDWQYMEEANDQWCFVRGSFADANASKVKNYYVRQQVTRFIPAGYTFVTSLNEQSLAAINPTADTLSVVLLNNSTEAQHNISLPMARINGDIKVWRTSDSESLKSLAASLVVKAQTDSTLTVALPQMSITTLLIPVRTRVEHSDELVDGDTYLIIPQSNSVQAVGVAGSTIKLVNINPSDPAQQWTPVKDANGSWRLRNGLGKYATGSTSYGLTLTANATVKSELFDIDKVDGIFSRIMWHNDGKRAWDLNGGTSAAGTTLGLYNYGSTADADTRQFLFVRINSASMDNDETGIQQLQNSQASTSNDKESIYDLSGRKLSKTSASSLPKGIYIVGGKKVLK